MPLPLPPVPLPLPPTPPVVFPVLPPPVVVTPPVAVVPGPPLVTPGPPDVAEGPCAALDALDVLPSAGGVPISGGLEQPKPQTRPAKQDNTTPGDKAFMNIASAPIR